MPPRKSKSKTSTSAASDTTCGALRVAGYCRYSEGPDQDDASLDAQHNAILREARMRGDWRVTFVDEPSRSAFVEDMGKRPKFLELLADAEAGKYDIVCVDKLDRWSRRQKITLDTWDRLHRAGVGFYSVKERLDFTTPAGWLSANMLASLAEFYSRNLSTEVQKGQLVRAQRGLQHSRAPYGYRKTTDTTAEPDTGEGGTWDGLQHLYTLLLAGMTHIEAAAAMNREGYTVRGPGKGKRTGEPRPFTNTLISRIVHNVFYRPFQPGDTNGTIVWQGEEYRGQHIAACSWDDWRAMCTASAGRRRGWQSERGGVLLDEPYTAEFRGIAACVGCGHRLHVVRAVNAQYGTNYERYICKSRLYGGQCVYAGQWARVSEVRALWVAWLRDHLRFSPDWQRDIRDAVLHRESSAARNSRHDEIAAARERQRWNKRREDAKWLLLRGELTREEWERIVRDADTALAALAAAAREPEQHIARMVDAGNMALSVAVYWDVWTTQERQQAAQLLLEPLGLVVRPLGHRGLYHRYQREDERPPSCELVDVRLCAPARDLLATLQNAQDHATG